MSELTNDQVTESLEALVADMSADERAVFDMLRAERDKPGFETYSPEISNAARAYAAGAHNLKTPSEAAQRVRVPQARPAYYSTMTPGERAVWDATSGAGMDVAEMARFFMWADAQKDAYGNPGTKFETDVAADVYRDRVKFEARKIRLGETSAFGMFDASALVTAEEVADEAEIEHLIEGVLERETITMLVADSYVGKSYLGIDWGLSIACGIDWHGRNVNSGKVLYLMMEGAKTTRARIESWSERRQVDLEGLGDYFSVYNRTVNFMDADSVSALADTVRDKEIDLVIIDTLSRAIGGANENSAEDMGQFVAAVSQVREAREGASVLILHHTKKENKYEYRGSTVLFAAMDTVFCLTREDDKTPFRSLENQKMKSGVLQPVQNMTFESCLGSATLEPTALLAGDVTLIALTELIGYGPEVTRKALMERLVSDGTYKTEAAASNRIKALDDLGKIEAYGPRKSLVKLPLRRAGF